MSSASTYLILSSLPSFSGGYSSGQHAWVVPLGFGLFAIMLFLLLAWAGKPNKKSKPKRRRKK